VAKTPPPEVPRGELTPAALGLWFTRFRVWAAEMAARTLALESGTSSAGVAGDGAALHSFMHHRRERLVELARGRRPHRAERRRAPR
jgi:hypothetical protein